MTKPKAVGLGAIMNDDASRAMLYEGCSQKQLATLFNLDPRRVGERLHKVPSCGERQGYPIYKLSDAAPYLVAPDEASVVDVIKRMGPRDLPPSLTKEFWTAQKARAEFEEAQGDLWRTGAVVEMFGEVFKTLRMSILLMRDQVERQTELSDTQRTIIQELTDGVLNELATSLVEKFKHDKRRAGSQWGDPDADAEIPDLDEDESL